MAKASVRDRFARLADLAFVPHVGIAALVMKALRNYGIKRLPLSRKVLHRVGIYPIREHYYEPMFNMTRLRGPLRAPRQLPGIDWNLDAQRALLRAFHWNDELRAFPMQKPSDLEYGYDNPSFQSGDAETLYNVVRHFKPRRIIEIGCGNSTLVALAAAGRNAAEDPSAACAFTCVEPYEVPWLDELDVDVIRHRVEELPLDTFAVLEANDILFIDSSHMIRPQGDVLFEILQVLPTLKPGVLVHVHDIFSPRDYLDEWLNRDMLFWNEQYLLEAFLSCNPQYEILLAVNYLRHEAYDALAATCPMLTPVREPGSFWIRRTAA